MNADGGTVMGTRHMRRGAGAALCTAIGAMLVVQAGVGYAAPAQPDAKLPAPRFTSASSTTLNGLFPRGMAVGDFTGDGRQDVVVAVASVSPVPGIQVLVGDGKG